MRSVNIVASDNDHRKLEALLVRMDQHFCGSFACSIWVGGGQNAGLQQIIRIVSDLSVHLICGNVDELLDSNLLCALQKDVCAINVGMGEGVRVSKTQIHMGLRRKMEDCINVVSLQTVHHLGRVGDVAMVECKVALVVQGSSIVQGCAVVELIEGDDVVRVWVR